MRGKWRMLPQCRPLWIGFLQAGAEAGDAPGTADSGTLCRKLANYCRNIARFSFAGDGEEKRGESKAFFELNVMFLLRYQAGPIQKMELLEFYEPWNGNKLKLILLYSNQRERWRKSKWAMGFLLIFPPWSLRHKKAAVNCRSLAACPEWPDPDVNCLVEKVMSQLQLIHLVLEPVQLMEVQLAFVLVASAVLESFFDARRFGTCNKSVEKLRDSVSIFRDVFGWIARRFGFRHGRFRCRQKQSVLKSQFVPAHPVVSETWNPIANRSVEFHSGGTCVGVRWRGTGKTDEASFGDPPQKNWNDREWSRWELGDRRATFGQCLRFRRLLGDWNWPLPWPAVHLYLSNSSDKIGRYWHKRMQLRQYRWELKQVLNSTRGRGQNKTTKKQTRSRQKWDF